MAYIDKTYYENLGGAEVDNFTSVANRVSLLIDAVTFRAVERFKLQDTKMFDLIKQACAMQIDFIASNFSSVSEWEADEQMQSESMGNYSYTLDKGRATVNGLKLAPSVVGILAPVIALGRKVGC